MRYSLRFLLYPISLLGLFASLGSCAEKRTGSQKWVLDKTITLDGVNPIGLAVLGDSLWLSDGDHNRVVAVNERGALIDSIGALERPMHIAAHQNQLWIPQYGADSVIGVNPSTMAREILVLKDALDAPAAVSFFGAEKAIADFYNHRILYFNGDSWLSFGKEGKDLGEFYYPTDVQITQKFIWVADAYNNRVQVFDKQGQFVQVIGASQKMNAATGLFVSEEQLFVTDFENHRVLIFYHDGQLAQVLDQGLEKPIDALIIRDSLYVADYKMSQLQRYYFDR